MAVPEALKYLPKERKASHAFDEVNRQYPQSATLEAVTALPLLRVQQMSSDYVTTSVAYIANYCTNRYLEEVGTSAWHAINQRRALTAYCEDARSGAMQIGLPLQYALRLEPDEPNLMVLGKTEGKVKSETTIAIIPPHLIVRARQAPVEALAAMVFIMSQIRDFANGRTYIDREWMTPRARAIEAQFLLQALEEQPDLQLAPLYREIIAGYPRGIQDLPPSARYKGTAGTETRKAGLN